MSTDLVKTLRRLHVTLGETLALVEECGMSPKLVLSRLDALAAAIRPAARKVAESLPKECPSEVYGEILKAIDRQIDQVRVGSDDSAIATDVT